MMIEIQENYSSQVQLELVMGDQTIGLSKIGPGYVVLERSVQLPKGEAQIVMHVDGSPHVWSVALPYGSVPFDDVVKTIAK